MSGIKDPLSFGAPDEDLDDLTEQLDATLLADPYAGSYALGDPLSSSGDGQTLSISQQQLHADDPFASLAAGATYGQLVAPQVVTQPEDVHQKQVPGASQSAAIAPPAHAADANPLPSNHELEPAAGHASSSSSSSFLPGSSGDGLVEQPSGSSISRIASPHWPAQAPAKDLPLLISVSEPIRKEGAGMLGMKASHIEYLVTTRSSLPGWSAPEVSVRRRFRDFVSLAELLKAKFRGYFVPARPEKNAVEGQRMSDSFVEERRAGLQKYLQKLAAHPVIGPSDVLRVFLEMPGDLSSNVRWSGLQPPSASIMEGTAKFSMQLIGRESRVVDPVAAAQPAARSKDLMRAMKEAAQGIGMRGGREVPLEELDLRRMREAAEEMREQLGGTSRSAEKLVAKLDQLGGAAGDLGLSLFKVAKFEEAEGGALASYTGTLRYSSSLIADEKRTAAALVRVSKMMGKVIGRVALELGSLHDALAAMPAAIRGYMSREHQMLTWHTLAADLEAKQKLLADTDKSKLKRVEELKMDISRLELSITSAKAEYEKIKAANLSETTRFAAERRAEYSLMLENFTAIQVAASERMAEVWVQLASELGASPEELAAVRTNDTGLLATASQPPQA